MDFLPDGGEDFRCESGAFDDEEKPLAELAQQFDVQPNQITTRKNQLLEGARGVFGEEKAGSIEAPRWQFATPSKLPTILRTQTRRLGRL
ncbi:hypothetical protein K9U39_14345 [Rhodoblastus acidophilus]|uniref:Uncharacterized protein n=1 Tax=Candidatus Rhodoblastus alkanivorans TaxID=2954117 RepID=A0ABS9ZAZ0_9HYPH|nr:hypothetical protein [Candidatus Rhodoblastus alkanivorans]MCI4680035.1 hypothetical protein [Candidatus Rhodoblastus alkanivorans]MCI4684783.1 hypothetical protein [Candidatus Rhodoblastus alkanivorans]MDI4642107.1 hypothetical protein [Rhodoblastus acidophilus]